MSANTLHKTACGLSAPRVAVCAFVMSLVLPSAAGATSISFSRVQTDSGTVTDNGGGSSAVMVDGENFAQSFSNPHFGKMGAAASNSLFEGESLSRSSFDDSWACLVNACGIPGQPAGNVPLSLDFKLDGVLTDFVRPHGVGTGTPELSILARYEIGVFGSFEFRLEENEFDRDEGPLGAGSRVQAKFCHSGACSDLPVVVVSFIDDNDNDAFSFSIDAKANQVLCPGCAAGFVDKLSLQVDVVGGNNVTMINALNTFQVTVHSLDPNFQFVSDAGRTTGSAADPTPVPEPATLGSLGFCLLGVARRRFRR